MRTCTIGDCQREHFGRGMCHYHYQRERRENYPLADKPCAKCGAPGRARGTAYCMKCCSARAATRRAALRQTVINHYGGACSCCGVTESVFLAVDHKNNDGAKHRREVSNARFMLWIINQGFPDDLQLLCHNCNWAKQNGGCPHQTGVTTNAS